MGHSLFVKPTVNSAHLGHLIFQSRTSKPSPHGGRATDLPLVFGPAVRLLAVGADRATWCSGYGRRFPQMEGEWSMKQKGFQCRVVVCVREIISDELHHPILAQIDG